MQSLGLCALLKDINDPSNSPPAAASQILFKGPRLKGGISMGAVKADLSSSSGHVTYRGHAVASLHRLLTEAKTSQVGCAHHTCQGSEVLG